MPVDRIVDLLAQRVKRQHVALTGSGSAALILALRAAGLADGAEVVMPAICCPAVLFAIQFAGFEPVLADVDLSTMNSGLPEIERVVTPRTGAIVAVHGFGRDCGIEAIAAYAKANRLFLIEDACLSLGGSVAGGPIGQFGDVSIFSFGYDKPIARNGGGALASNDAGFWSTASSMLAENPLLQYERPETDLSGIGADLESLDQAVATRIENVHQITSRLSAGRIAQPSLSDSTPYWRYPVLFDGDRAALIELAKAHGLLFTTHYRNLAELSTGLRCINAEYTSSRLLNFFVRPTTQLDDILRKVDFLNEHAN